MSCSCPLTANFMAQIGAVRSAELHRKGKGYVWTLSDLTVHFGEEDKFFFPLVLRELPEEATTVARLRREHGIMLAEMRLFGRVSPELFDRHAKEEDRLAAKIARKLRMTL